MSPCRNISVSTMYVTAGLNCAACSHLDFENTGVTFTADNVALTKKVVKLCEGESVEIGIKDDVSGKDKDDKIYHGYIVDWYEGSVSGTAKKNKNKSYITRIFLSYRNMRLCFGALES